MVQEVKEEVEIPEFKQKYISAFVCLMLYKQGGFQTITIDQLEKYPEKDEPIVEYNGALKAFTLRSPEVKKKRKRGIVTPSKKIIH